MLRWTAKAVTRHSLPKTRGLHNLCCTVSTPGNNGKVNTELITHRATTNEANNKGTNTASLYYATHSYTWRCSISSKLLWHSFAKVSAPHIILHMYTQQPNAHNGQPLLTIVKEWAAHRLSLCLSFRLAHTMITISLVQSYQAEPEQAPHRHYDISKTSICTSHIRTAHRHIIMQTN